MPLIDIQTDENGGWVAPGRPQDNNSSMLIQPSQQRQSNFLQEQDSQDSSASSYQNDLQDPFFIEKSVADNSRQLDNMRRFKKLVSVDPVLFSKIGEIKKPVVDESAQQSRGLVSEAASRLGRGTVQAIGNLGYAAEMADLTPREIDKEAGNLDKIGRAVIDWSEKMLKESPSLQPDKRELSGEEGFVRRGVMSGLESIPQSLVPFITGAAGFAVGGAPGAVIGGTLGLVTTFGAGQYGQEYKAAYEELTKNKPDMPEEEKRAIANKDALGTAAYEVGTEWAQDLFAYLTFGGSTLLKAPMTATLKALLKKTPKQFIKEFLKVGAVEAGGEAINAAGEAKLRQDLGLESPGMGEAAVEAILPALTMTFFLGAGSAGLNTVQSRAISKALNSDDVKTRIEAADVITKRIAENTKDKTLAKEWRTAARTTIAKGEKFDFDQKLADFAAVKTAEEVDERLKPTEKPKPVGIEEQAKANEVEKPQRPPLQSGFQGPVQVNPRSGGWAYQEAPATAPQGEVVPAQEMVVEPPAKSIEPPPGPAEKSAQVIEKKLSGEERLRQSRKGADLLRQQLREQEKIITSEDAIIKTAIDEVKAGRPGRRHQVDAPYGPGGPEFIGESSTYPQWMKDNDWDRKEVLDALDRAEHNGKIGKMGRLLPITDKQRAILVTVDNYYRDEEARAKANEEFENTYKELLNDTDIQRREVEEAKRAGEEEAVAQFNEIAREKVPAKTNIDPVDGFNWDTGKFPGEEGYDGEQAPEQIRAELLGEEIPTTKKQGEQQNAEAVRSNQKVSEKKGDVGRGREEQSVSDLRRAGEEQSGKVAEGKEAAPREVKEPWQMTLDEWDKERAKIRPETFGDSPAKASISKETKRIKRLEYLLYGVTDEATNKMKKAIKGEITLTPDEVNVLQERIDAPVFHQDVIEKALSEGKPVPAEVLADYPNLQKQKSTPAKEPLATAKEPAPEGGVIFETGKPVTFTYSKNKEKAPNMGERFKQHIEPKGNYVTHNYTKDRYLVDKFPDKYDMGEMTFKNPLVVEIKEALDHKDILYKKYGKKGAALSRAIVKDGYDGIVSRYPDGSTGEIIDLKSFIKKSNKVTPEVTKEPIETKPTPSAEKAKKRPETKLNLKEDVPDIGVDTLPRNILSSMNRTLKAKGFDVRGIDDIRTLLKKGSVYRPGEYFQKEWKEAYEVALGTTKKRKEILLNRSKFKNINWQRIKELGKTTNLKEAGYIVPDGSLTDLSGKKEGGQPGVRSLDHREAGGTSGMRELMAYGYIRMDDNSGSIDISKEPTFAQYKVLRQIISKHNGDIVLDLEDGLGKYDDKNDSYSNPERRFSNQYDKGAETSKIILDVKKFFAGEMPVVASTRFNLAPTWYSQLERILEKKLPNFGDAKMMRDTINSWASKGEFKADELKWTGLDEFLAGKEGKITKAEVLDYLRANQVEIKEVTKGLETNEKEFTAGLRKKYGLHSIDWFFDHQNKLTNEEVLRLNSIADKAGKAGPTKFHQWQEPGGENYRELLLTLPNKVEKLPPGITKKEGSYYDATGAIIDRAAFQNFMPQQAEYQSSHFDEPNIIAHVRMNDRVDTDGNKVLFLEEVQSDWHQSGRKKGYKLPYNEWKKQLDDFWADAEEETLKKRYSQYQRSLQRVPAAPFSKTWQELALKRMLRYAAENGYDKLAWTTGKMQADRYDLSKHVDLIGYQKRGDDLFNLTVWGKKGEQIYQNQSATAKDIEDTIGKELAQKIVDNVGRKEDGFTYLEDLDLKVGGEGMKGFYDKIIPSFLNKYAKKWGARVEETKIFKDKAHKGLTGKTHNEEGFELLPEDGMAVQSLPITPSMKESVLQQGQALFNFGTPIINSDTFRDHRKAVGQFRKWMRTAGLSKAELAKTDIEIREVVKIMGDIRRSMKEHGKIEADLSKVLGSTTFFSDMTQLVQFTSNMDLIDAENTALHEAIHIVLNRMTSDAIREKALSFYNGNEESFVKDCATFVVHQETTSIPKFVRKAFYHIKKVLHGIANGFKASEYKTPEDFFKAIYFGADLKGGQAGVNEFAQSVKLSLDKAVKKITDNPNFVKWFGGSKVVDENGEPLVVYHWTDYEFNIFDMVSSGGLAHFGTKKAAWDRSRGMSGIGYEIEKDDDGYYVYSDSGPNEGEGQGPFKTNAEAKSFIKTQPKKIDPMAVYLNLKNPLRVPDLGVWPFDGVRTYLSNNNIISDKEASKAWKSWQQSDSKGWESLKSILAKHGYDGLIYTNEMEDKGNDSYIAFNPTQIKSIYNQGTFDPNNPDIRLQVEAWHGSPHELKKFDMSKVGTGEGAQAFGWGMYFTSESDIAKYYAKKLTDWTNTEPEGLRNLYKVTLHKGKQPGEYTWLDWDKPVDKSIFDKLGSSFKAFEDRNNRGDLAPYWTGEILYNKITSILAQGTKDEAILKDATKILSVSEDEMAYENSGKYASLYLLAKGIDGIRYPAGSLSGAKDTGSKNYVVFDENAVTVEAHTKFNLKQEPRIDYIGEQEKADGTTVSLYNAFGVEGIQDGSTVTENTLKKMGIIPSKKPGESKLNAVEAVKEFHNDMASYAEGIVNFIKGIPETKRIRAANKVKRKADTNAFQRYFATPFFSFRKVPAAWRMFEDGQRRSDNFYEKVDDLSKAKDGQYWTIKLSKAKKQIPEEYKKISKTLKYLDQNAIGHKVKQEETDGLFILSDPKGKEVGKFNTEDDAWEAATQRDLQGYRDKGFSDQAVDAVEAVIRLRHAGFKMLSKNIREVIAKYKAMGMDLPEYSVWQDGEKIKVDLKVELARLGDLRGYYMPHSWKAGKIIVYAKKEGTHGVINKFDSEMLAANWERSMQAKGYTTESKISGAMPEDVFEMAGKTVAVNAMLNEALDRLKAKDITLADFGLKGEIVDGVGENKDFILTGATNKKQGEVLKDMGGKWYKASETELERWHFINKDKSFEKQLAKALATSEVSKMVDQETTMLFAGNLAEQMGNIIKERGARKHMIHRSGARGIDVWEGYEEDPDIAMAQYVRSLAAAEAKHIMATDMVKHLTGTDISWAEYKGMMEDEGQEKPEYEDYLDFIKNRRIDPAQQQNMFKDATIYMKDMLRNQEKADRVIGQIKGLAVLKYLGFKMSALPINMSAMLTTVPASMKGYADIGFGKAFTHMARMSKMYVNYTRYERSGDTSLLPKKYIDLFEEIERKGWGTPQFNREALATLESKVGRGWSRLIELSMTPFAITETFNRMVTISASYEGARANGKSHDEALEIAKDVSDHAHAVYGKVNYPHLLRGENLAAQALKCGYVFKQFNHNYLQTMLDLGYNKKDAQATLWIAASPVVLGGAGAFAGTALVKAALQAFGADDPEEWFYSQVEENLGEKAGIVARVGAPGLFGVSLKGSLSLDLTSIPTKPSEFMGAPGSVISDIYDAGKLISKGSTLKAVEKLLPSSIAAPVKAYRESTEGVTTGSNLPVFYGNKPLAPDLMESIIRFLGFSPSRLAAAREKQWNEKQIEQKYNDRRRNIYSKFHHFYSLPVEDRSKSKMVDLLAEVKHYNEDLIQSGLMKKGYSPITKKLLVSNIKRGFKPSKKERLREVR